MSTWLWLIQRGLLMRNLYGLRHEGETYPYIYGTLEQLSKISEANRRKHLVVHMSGPYTPNERDDNNYLQLREGMSS